ncbi:precorrin-6y C5,15-methyltransferase (decarboxylating) subunit CbiE [Anaerosinus massiliensis]|uniref:precorrin-6y C5,15-methyltransferase (decarboxylating) subunit CbiE n=1 Tax=Massilibacillus massiliensis TaxID=1806837 RepID=UPI000A6DD827|nr:precorrin-6y C5,15-methyltransferase (decarboxylating) subunit CbiE [Massilibacillus massiliensis]
MEHKIIVVGIGPGSKDYILPIAQNFIHHAKVLLGSKRALDTFANSSCLQHRITGDIPSTMSFIQENLQHHDIIVMVSGDPGYYSLLAALRENFKINQLQVIPGISSMQLAFARLSLPWQEATLISLHGRKPYQADLQYKSKKVLGILTDTVYTSTAISRLLLENNWPNETTLYICSRLSYANEEIIETTIQNAAKLKVFTHCIMVVVA